MRTPPGAVIFGCAGHNLTADEHELFKSADPLGFILFARNVDHPDQVRGLVNDLRAAVGREDAPVLIDQEGGRVQRIGPPNWQMRPPQGLFAHIAAKDCDAACAAARLNAQLIAVELSGLGIDVDCLPLLDVPVEGAHDIIGDRAFGHDPGIIAVLGKAVIDGLMAGGVQPVIKHLPGHGRAGQDSHLELPRVDTDAATLRATDFAPFRALSGAPWGMTAHIVYDAFDADQPATLSKTVIDDVIRGEIGFQGVLLSDDVNMKALSGSAADNVAASLDAGCDAALHCNGEFAEMVAVAETLPRMTDTAMQRWHAVQAMMPPVEAINAVTLQAQLDATLAHWQ